MKYLFIIALHLVIVVSCVATQKKIVLKTQRDSISYSIGTNLGNNFKKQSIELDQNIFFQGFKDAYAGGSSAMTEEAVMKTLTEFQSQMTVKQQENAKVLGEKNKKEGEEFLAANKQKEGVTTLPSGLQYKILKAGTGPVPKNGETITANYRGTLINGKEFDNTYKRGKPLTIGVNNLIKGWTEALLLMPVGSKWELFVPPGLAYAERGYGLDIGPNATLIFEMELLSTK